MDSYNQNQGFGAQAHAAQEPNQLSQGHHESFEQKAEDYNREAGQKTGNLVDQLTGKGGVLNHPLAKAAAVGLLAFAAAKINSSRK